MVFVAWAHACASTLRARTQGVFVPWILDADAYD